MARVVTLRLRTPRLAVGAATMKSTDGRRAHRAAIWAAAVLALRRAHNRAVGVSTHVLARRHEDVLAGRDTLRRTACRGAQGVATMAAIPSACRVAPSVEKATPVVGKQNHFLRVIREERRRLRLATQTCTVDARPEQPD
mmetsp:Transcript_22150/g.58719  ORF Transcript_22150/g.58719 Transcript_22150/m.58719 type:complete len:140 (-) Transcript_22150:177-596(-)